MLFVPTTSRLEASATEDNSSSSSISTTERESEPGITTLTDTSASISVPSSIDFTDVLPTTTGATTTATANINVTTTNSAGYNLYLYSSSDNNSLKPSNPANNSSISATTTTSTLNDLTNNTWGYNLDTTSAGTDALYATVPTNGSTPIQTKYTSTTNSANDTYTLTLGAKVDTNIPSGTYTNTLTIAVVAEPPAVADITGLTYMQEMTPEICEATTVGATATLTDKRDNNTYTVAKLPDGACWMTQNLRLAGGATIDGMDSNVTFTYTLPADSTASGTFYNNDGSVHYSGNVKYGSYYDFCAASAGTRCGYSSSVASVDSIHDICPNGWKLPSLDQFNGITNQKDLFLPTLSGGYNGNSLGDVNTYGYWWSSTADHLVGEYYMVYDGGILSTRNMDRRLGFSVRCVHST